MKLMGGVYWIHPVRLSVRPSARMLLENDGNFGEVINGTDIVRTQRIYPSMTYLCKRPLGLGFVQATGAH